MVRFRRRATIQKQYPISELALMVLRISPMKEVVESEPTELLTRLTDLSTAEMIRVKRIVEIIHTITLNT